MMTRDKIEATDTDELIERLRHLVSLNEPAHGGPFQGIAAQECVRAMSDAIAALTAPVEAEPGPMSIDHHAYRVAHIPEPSALSAGAVPGVRELEWKKPKFGSTDTMNRAETMLGTYRAWTHQEANGKWFWHLSGVVDGIASSESEAKAAAQADYASRILSALTAPVAGEEPVWFVVDQNGLCLVPDEHVEAVRKLFSGPDIEVNGRKLKKAVRVYAHPLASPPIGDGVVVPREPDPDTMPLPDAFVTCTSAAPDYFVTIKTTTLKEAQNWHDAVLGMAQRGRG